MKRSDKSIEIVDNLRFVNVYLMRVADRLFSRYELNQSQFAVLNEIVRNPGLNQTEIMDKLMLEKSNLSKIVKKLNRNKLIKVMTPKNDKRSTIPLVTEKGEKLWEECVENLNQLKMKFASDLDDEKRDRILDSTRVLRELVENYTKNKKGIE